MPLGEGCWAWERWLLKYAEWLSTGILAAISSVLSPESPTPDSPQASLVHSALPLSQPRLSGCNKILCIGPLRGCVCLQPSLPGRKKPCCFHSWMLSGFLSGSDAVGWGAQLRVYHPPNFSRGSPATEISLQNFSCCPWEPSQPSRASSALPASLVMVKWFLLSVLGYKASLQPVFSWLYRMISLPFSCNSTLVLGGG